MTTSCRNCGRELPNGYACHSCVASPAPAAQGQYQPECPRELHQFHNGHCVTCGVDADVIVPQPSSGPSPTPDVRADDPVTWRGAALRLGEDLTTLGPPGESQLTPAGWLRWMRAALRAPVSPAPQEPLACINCGVSDDGAYGTPNVGPFCEPCWAFVIEEATPPAPHGAREALLMALSREWREQADGVEARGYSQQADRLRDCARDLAEALQPSPDTKEPR